MSIQRAAAVLAVMSLPVLTQAQVVVQWSRAYAERCRVTTATSDAVGDLWSVCGVTLSRFDGKTGTVRLAREMRGLFAPKSVIRESSRRLVRMGGRVVLLSNTESDAQDRRFEGVQMTPLRSDGEQGEPITVIGPGPQLQDAAESNDGSLLLAADQGPISVRKVPASGGRGWMRCFPAGLADPSIAALADGDVCVLAKTGSGVRLIRLNSGGETTARVSIPFLEGAVAEGPAGGCAVLYSASRTQRRLALFDRSLHRQWDSLLPFSGRGGRDCRLWSVEGGWTVVVANVFARLRADGSLLWQVPLANGFQRFVPTSGGGYIIAAGLVSRVRFE